ncbi:MAG: hypothetical protein F6K63_29775 [Moorea sp. SIO1G6]|uniref:hypothetical protein n=1 Tax=Moorena sp. SIO1G6 TaxID=2607840 RepID=UPI0013C18D94|nr:hypothetical protein [Moorena sp. SIO1G6]NET68359.1 hypothetical protein [Moorena sp. SIO1G6]
MTAKTTVFNTNINSSIEFASALKKAFGYAGYSLSEETHSGAITQLDYELSLDVTTYTLHYRLEIDDSLKIRQLLVKDKNGVNPILSKESAWETYEPGSVVFNCCSHKELPVVLVSQEGTSDFIVGAVRPYKKEDFWDESIYPFYFVFERGDTINPGLSSFASDLSPYGRNSYELQTIAGLHYPSSITQQIDLIAGLYLFSGNSEGVAGEFSEDVGRFAGHGVKPGNMGTASPTVRYLFLTAGGTSGIALRTDYPIEG